MTDHTHPKRQKFPYAGEQNALRAVPPPASQLYFITVWWGTDPETADISSGEDENHWETWGFPSREERDRMITDPIIVPLGAPYFLVDRDPDEDFLVGTLP